MLYFADFGIEYDYEYNFSERICESWFTIYLQNNMYIVNQRRDIKCLETIVNKIVTLTSELEMLQVTCNLLRTKYYSSIQEE